MKYLIWIVLISLPVFADVGPKYNQHPMDVNPPKIKTDDLDVQMEEDQERGTEIEKQREMEKNLQKGLEQSDEDELKTQKDF